MTTMTRPDPRFSALAAGLAGCAYPAGHRLFLGIRLKHQGFRSLYDPADNVLPVPAEENGHEGFPDEHRGRAIALIFLLTLASPIGPFLAMTSL